MGLFTERSNEESKQIVDKSIADFHVKRRIFIVINDTLLIAPEDCEMTHAEWIQSIFPDKYDGIIKTQTRGYVYGNKIAFYIGNNFSARINHDSVIIALDVFQRMFNLCVIGFGAKIDSVGQPWKSIREMKITKYLARRRV